MHKSLLNTLLAAAFCASSHAAFATQFDIPAQPLDSALTMLARQSGIQILFNPADLQGLQSPALQGNLETPAAVNKLLAGSGLQADFRHGSYVIRRLPGHTANFPEIRISATADSGYKAPLAGVASKVPLAPRQIANSVSVLTRQQIEDQNLITMQDALQQVTGINVIANDTSSAQYYARGYGLGVMYDGVTSYNGMTPSHQFDLPLYERIEVLRGPAGLLRGVGEPGGVVNLVKKRPRKDFAFSWAAGAGSWDNYRLEGDLTGPLNQDGSLRGRLVLAEENRGYFYDHTHGQKWLAMGALEYDLTPATTLGLSFTAQDADVKAPSSGLPASSIIDGKGHYQLLDVSRSTFNAPDWGKLLYHTEELSFSAEHRFANEWVAKLTANQRDWRQYYKYAYTYSSVNATTGRLDYASMQGDYDYSRDGVDLFANGPFELLGRKHNLLLGFNWERYENTGKFGRGPIYTNVLFGDLRPLTEPSIAYTSGSDASTEQHGFYSQLRLSLADPLTLVLGGRTTHFLAKSRNIAPSVPNAWKDGAKTKHEFTPYLGLLYDLSKEITLYGSYADIFTPQTQLKADGSTLDPRVGKQYELGGKGEFLDGKLAASLAWFDIRDKNRAYADPAYPTSNFYLNAGEVESKGWEIELSGKPARGLDVIAGYTYLTTKFLKDRKDQGKSYSIQTPKHQFKLWSNYRFDQDSALAGFSVGLGILAQDKAQSSRGWRDEVVNSGYAVVNGSIAYQIDRHYSLTLAVNNILDRKYYASVGTPNSYNFYGEPRSFMLTLRGAY